MKKYKNNVVLILCMCMMIILGECNKKQTKNVITDSVPRGVTRVTIKSSSLGKKMNMLVYLPLNYDTNKKYPVLYLFHGYSRDEKQWLQDVHLAQKADELIAEKKINPIIIVTPDIENSWGINSNTITKVYGDPEPYSTHEGMYEDYLYKDVILYIDSNYNTIALREGRYIGGHSMGGFTSLHIAFKYTEMFSKAGGHSPALILDNLPDGKFLKKWLYPTEQSRKENDPMYLAQHKNLKNLQVYLDCGDQDDYKFYSGCERLNKILQSKGIKSEYHLNPGGHNDGYMIENIEKYLIFYAGI